MPWMPLGSFRPLSGTRRCRLNAPKGKAAVGQEPATCLVALTFDFDAESSWLASAAASGPSALSRGAYGANEGVPRILKLLDEFAIPATFFVPGDTADRHSEIVKRIVAAGHEIGHHGYLHEPPHLLTPQQERSVLERGLEALARHGVKPVGYRSPGGEVSALTYPLLLEYGFRYDSSQVGRDTPYWVEVDGRPTELVEVPFAWELTDSAHFFFAFGPTYMAGMSAPSKVEEIWWGDFDGAYKDHGIFVLTLHPEVMGRRHRMALLERTIRHMLEFSGTRFTQMRGIADSFRSQNDGWNNGEGLLPSAR
jgi:peptidoglycan-N-acetylglucosamine deacetylase